MSNKPRSEPDPPTGALYGPPRRSRDQSRYEVFRFTVILLITLLVIIAFAAFGPYALQAMSGVTP
jgi:hypothetical protein